MRAAVFLILLIPVCWTKPFQQLGFLDFMMEDEGSALPPAEVTPFPEKPMKPERPERPPFISPVPPPTPCPFACQCHLRVVQCSDLGLKEVPEKISVDTTLLDLQNNKISKIKENDFKNMKFMQILILVNNKITTIDPKAFAGLVSLQRLHLSKNLLKSVPQNMPKSLQELRLHENEITEVKKSAFDGLAHLIVIELGTNPFRSSGIEKAAFQGLKKVSYIRIADTNITAIPQGLPSSLSELHLDGNSITRVDADSLKGLNNLAKLGLSYNKISTVENGSIANIPHLRELHLDHNVLTRIPAGLHDHKYIQVVYLHNNKIAAVDTNDFCPPGFNTKKASYSGISLFSNPVQYWEVPPSAFRCIFDRGAVHIGNYK